MGKARKIGIIGAGIFGSLAGIELSKLGYQVTVFEKNAEILTGATANSQNRLHLGLHYPRDFETAIQSIKGFVDFSNRFPDSIFDNFNNYYAVAKQNSKISYEDFLKFCSKTKIPVEPKCDIPESFLKNTDFFGGLIKSREAVIDMKFLRDQLIQELVTTQVAIHLEATVTRVEKRNNEFLLESTLGSHNFDFIVRATYGTDRIESSTLELHAHEFEYQNTVISILQSEEPAFGLTVVDGDFLTVLPYGRTGKFLAYGPSISTLNKVISSGLPQSEDFQLDTSKYEEANKLIASRTRDYLPEWNFQETGQYLKAIRTIRLETKKTDRRTSHIKQSAQNFFDIWSGKIDHCVEIANLITSEVQKCND